MTTMTKHIKNMNETISDNQLQASKMEYLSLVDDATRNYEIKVKGIVK